MLFGKASSQSIVRMLLQNYKPRTLLCWRRVNCSYFFTGVMYYHVYIPGKEQVNYILRNSNNC